MKNSIIIMLTLIALLACAKNVENTDATNKPAKIQVKVDKAEEQKDPLAATITVKEVARIALLQADQMQQLAAKKAKTSVADAEKILAEAHYLYRKEKFKQAQIKAVAAKRLYEKAMFTKKANKK